MHQRLVAEFHEPPGAGQGSVFVVGMAANAHALAAGPMEVTSLDPSPILVRQQMRRIAVSVVLKVGLVVDAGADHGRCAHQNSRAR